MRDEPFTTLLRPGDATLTRRCKKRCEEIGHVVQTTKKWNIYGSVITGYLIPTGIFEEETARRKSEQATKAAKIAAKKSKKQERLNTESEKARKQRLDELRSAHTHLSESQVSQNEASGPLYRPLDLGYLRGRATKTYWMLLGYDLRQGATTCGTLMRGLPYPVYASYELEEPPHSVTTETLWERWCEKHGSPAIALAEAIKVANRLQKVRKNPTFYPLKDRWIRLNQHNLSEGLIAREEINPCWHCCGDDGCYHCGGSGVYSRRTLYEHRFLIEGRHFSFHSYARPSAIAGSGADLPKYGLPFRQDELPLPPQSQIVEMVALGLRELFHGGES